jgi:hypothetical protein
VVVAGYNVIAVIKPCQTLSPYAVSVCRRHPIPTREMLEPLLRTAAAVGINLDVSSSKALADSLDHAVVCLAIWLI